MRATGNQERDKHHECAMLLESSETEENDDDG